MSLRFSSLEKPQGTWWHALGRDERLWVGIAVIWGLAMFLMISFVWPQVGVRQNEIKSYRVEPADYHAIVEEFTTRYKIGDVENLPLVAPPPGGDVYLEGMTFAWRPVVQLKRGETYRFFLSSRDVQHGFSLHAGTRSLNYQVLPGLVTVVSLTPEKTGEFPLVCNEYCGLGHHLMLGRVIVVD